MAQQQHKEQSWLTTASLVILAAVALAVVLIYTRAVMIPFVLAIFIVALVSPIQDFQVKRLRLPRVISVIVTLLVVLFAISVVSLFVAQAITTIVSTAGDYSASFAQMTDRLLKPIEYFYQREEPQGPAIPNSPAGEEAVEAARVKEGPVELFPMVQDTDGPVILNMQPPSEPVEEDFDEATGFAFDPNGLAEKEIRIDTKQIVKDLKNYIFNIVTNAFGTIFGLISGVFFVCVFVIFMLAGRNPYAEHSEVYKDVVQKVRRYVGTKVMISAITGILVWASLTIIGLPLAGVFGVLAFLLNFIPSLGSIFATLLPIPIAVAAFHQSPWLIVLAIVVPGAIQNVLGNFIEPKLMGEGLNLHPVSILLALSFWGLIWGIVGMFLAAPITAALRIVLIQFDMLKPIGNLLAGDFTPLRAPEPKEVRRTEGKAAPSTVAPEAEVMPSSTPPGAVEPAGSPPE